MDGNILCAVWWFGLYFLGVLSCVIYLLEALERQKGGVLGIGRGIPNDGESLGEKQHVESASGAGGSNMRPSEREKVTLVEEGQGEPHDG